MLKTKAPKVKGGLPGVKTKGKGGKRLPPKGAGLKQNQMLGFVDLSQNNLGMQGCFVRMMGQIASGIGDKDDKEQVGRKLKALTKLMREQYLLLSDLKKDLGGSGKDEF